MPLPYENATTGKNAIGEIQAILKSFGTSSVGFMEEFDRGRVLVQFEMRGRRVTCEASIDGYAKAWLRAYPWNSKRRCSEAEHAAKAHRQAQIAVWSILRDWIKGQVTAVEIGAMSFEGAFLAQLVTPDGRTVLERLEGSDVLRLPGASVAPYEREKP